MAELASLVQRLEVAVNRLESMSGDSGAPADVSAYVKAFDDLMNGAVAHYMSLSQKIGGDVQIHADMMKKVFSLQRDFLLRASVSQKPDDAVVTALLKPINQAVTAVQEFREKKRQSVLFNHLSAVSESVSAVGWLVMAPTPAPHVKEMQDAGAFYGNRVLKEYKEKDKTHVEWMKSLTAIWTELQNYIKQYHTTGLTWSKSGPVAAVGAAPPKAPAGGCPPPPPPGPPPPPMVSCAPSSGGGDAGDDRNALFASINQGADITKGLKHVSDDQKTHKNPALKSQAPAVRTGPKPFCSAPPRPAASATPTRSLPPMLELEGKKWKVENHDGAQDLKIEQTELKQVVYVYKCVNSTLQVKGKINSIIIDGCKKMNLVFDEVVGIVEIINSKSVTLQVLGKVPTVSINKTDGCQVFLSKDSMSCEIISAKSSEMNVSVPKVDGEFTEIPIPEQFKTIWDGQKFVTTATEIAG